MAARLTAGGIDKGIWRTGTGWYHRAAFDPSSDQTANCKHLMSVSSFGCVKVLHFVIGGIPPFRVPLISCTSTTICATWHSNGVICLSAAHAAYHVGCRHVKGGKAARHHHIEAYRACRNGFQSELAEACCSDDTLIMLDSHVNQELTEWLSICARDLKS